MKPSNLSLAEENLIEMVGNRLKAEILKAKDLADKDPFLVPATIATIFDSTDQEALRGAARLR